MTQPDEFHPAGAANYDSFAGFANTTEEEWQAQIDATMNPGIDPLSGICALFGQLPFLDGLASYGGYGQPGEDIGIASGAVNGIQLLADALCGLLTGGLLGGTTPDGLFGGVSDIMDLIFENPFTELLIELVDETGNILFDVLSGVLKFVNQIFGVFFDVLPLSEIIDILQELIDTLFGLFGGSGAGNFITDVVDALTGWLPDLLGLLGDPFGLGSGNVRIPDLENIPLLGPLIGLLNRILAFLTGGPLSVTPIGGIVNAFTSLLTRPFFDDSSAVVGAGVWTVDDTVTYNGNPSVKTVADGTVKELIGNPVAVSTGQKITASARAKWSGLTGSGSPIRLKLWTDAGDVELDSIAFSTSGDFTTAIVNPMSGTYSVPSNVTQAAMMLVVEASATAGTVWFNDQQSNMLPVASVVEDAIGVSGIFDDLFDIFNGSTGSSGKSLLNVFDIGKDFFDILAGIFGADFSDLALRFDEILQIFQALAGIVITPITSLVQDVIERFVNLTTGGLFNSQFLSNIANFPILAQDRISNLVSDLSARLTTTSFDDMRDRVAGAFRGVSSFNVSTNQGLADAFGDFFEVIANAPHNWTNLQNSITRNYQTFDILRGVIVTPIDAIIQGIKNWYDANF